MIIKKSQLIFNNDIFVPEKFIFDGDPDTNMLTNLMVERMRELGTIGLTAPQVSLKFNMFVMGIDDAVMEVFNPKITKYFEDEESVIEGTIHYPGVQVMVKRPITILVEYQNKKGEEVKDTLTGLSSRIFQHHFDLLIGLTIKDKVSKLKWKLASKRFNNKKNKFIKHQVQKKLLEIKKEIQQNDDSKRIS
jgi:peptide deformylase